MDKGGKSSTRSAPRSTSPSDPSADTNPAEIHPSGRRSSSTGEALFPEQTALGSRGGSQPLDMSYVASALPEYVYGQVSPMAYQQPYTYQSPQSTMPYPYQGSMMVNYQMPYPAQIPQQGFAPGQRPYIPYQVNPTMSSGQQIFYSHPYHPQQIPQHIPIQHPHHNSHFQPSQPQVQQFSHSTGTIYGPRPISQFYGTQGMVDHSSSSSIVQTHLQPEASDLRRSSSSTSLQVSSALRGPPRKPRQSGHALWVGNLPPGTNITDLKDHFSRDATNDIESVFLISKSNCAFVNYKTEESCAAAMGRFHNSRFNGVRLVCRLRRGSSPTSAINSGPITPNTESITRIDTTTPLRGRVGLQEQNENDKKDFELQQPLKVKERYFIIKSLTMDDLERSVYSGIWATQSHNEEFLNRAYQTAENVYLIFSANKSGEYFGYARMESAIDDESVANIDASSMEAQIPHRQSISVTPETPLTIPTPATITAPRGFIIDDSARGTIFWEAEPSVLQTEVVATSVSPGDAESDEENNEAIPPSPATLSTASATSSFGKPFKIAWLSTDRLPFYRTRGLRNPWNTNREVKIARDGTELEPSVGRKLVGMFHLNFVEGNRHQAQDQYATYVGSMPGQGPGYRPF